MTFLEVFLKPLHPKAAIVVVLTPIKAQYSPPHHQTAMLCCQTFSIFHLTLTTSNLHYIFLSLTCFISPSHSLFLLAEHSLRFIPAKSSSSEGLVLAIYGLIRLT